MALVEFNGKSIEKLIEVVSQGIGTLYKPRAMRKEADAECYKQEVLAKSQASIKLIESDVESSLEERAKNRLLLQEMNHQNNIEEIIEKSIPHLNEKVSEEEVDVDWRTRFFKKAQDVGNEDIQEIWAKILAQEISQPGNISLRTLEVMANLSKKEADIFELICSFVSPNGIIYKLKGEDALDEFNFNYTNLLLLRDSGLIHESDTLIINHTVTHSRTMLKIGDTVFFVSHTDKNKKHYTFEQIKLTLAGSELSKFLSKEKNEKYFEKLINEKIEEGYEFTKASIPK